jgi:hypothetical protein
MKNREADVLKACLDFLRIKGHFVCRINNGGFETKRGGYVRCSDIAGIADIVGVTIKGQALAVEVKSEKGRLSKLQEAFKSAWLARGGVYVLARDITDLQEAGL